MLGSILFLLFIFQANAAPPPAAPAGSGVWLLQNEAWLPMPPAPASKAKARGLDTYIYTDGYADLDIDVFFTGARAALRVSSREPVFLARADGGNEEPILVRLTGKKDRRVCRTRPVSASIGNKQGFRRQDIVRMILTANPDKSFTARPERPLKPGEYLFVTGSPADGRDFGVD